MGGKKKPLDLLGEVQINEVKDIKVSFLTPSNPGEYELLFTLESTKDDRFLLQLRSFLIVDF
jgi:hypothetical protein